MSISVRLKEILDSSHVPYKVISHPPAYTAEEVAESAHVSGYDMVKVVVAVADGKHVMVVLPANHRIDIPALRSILNCERVKLADESEFSAEFPDCEIGAMPPFGKLYGLRLIAALPLQSDYRIFFNAGSHREIIQMNRDDWERLAHPEWGEFSTVAH
jgi:Ala-tRNA(Pro) deacylase